MAKVTLTVEDSTDDEGEPTITMAVEADPPFDLKVESNNTAAHHAGIEILGCMKKVLKKMSRR